MIQDLTKYVDFLVEHKVTPKQFLLLYCLFLDRLEKQEKGRWYRQTRGRNQPVANMYKYASKVEGWKTEEVHYLESIGFIINKSDRKEKDSEYYPDNLELTPKFISLIFAVKSDFDEFWELYPYFVDNFQNPVSGPKIPLKGIPYSDVEKMYKEVIHSKIDHSRMMRALKWGIEHEQVKLRIDRFLESKFWVGLEGLMDENYGSESVRGIVI